jgi:hypothetical protein
MTEENSFEAWTDGEGNVILAERDPALFESARELAQNSELWNTNSTVARAIASWAEDMQAPNGNVRGKQALFERNKYVTPAQIYSQMGVAYEALDDDIVSNALDVTESLAFNRVRAISDDENEQDLWNQIFGDLDIDTWIRQAWRELFTVSHYYGVRWWGREEYKVRIKKEKRTSRKKYDIVVPTKIGFLDPMRVVPVNPNFFGEYQYAWIADEGDMALYDDVQANVQSDELVRALFSGRYKPSKQEEQQLQKQGVSVDRLLLLNSEFVWSHSLTKSTYERWPRLRLKSLFPLLDLKTQLRAMDRAVLLSGTNFIVLVKKGTDAHPVKRAAEMEGVIEQVRTVSLSPVIVSDHRLSIEIITPDIQYVLNNEMWATLDTRLMMRLWGTFVANPMEGRDDSLTLGRVIARGISSRRHMLKRDIEKNIIKPVYDTNEDELEGKTKLEFTPQRIELEMDEAIANIIQELRDRGDISRETTLNELGFDQDIEAMRREREDDRYEDIFTPPQVPFDSPSKMTPGGEGRKGGRPAGSPNDTTKTESQGNKNNG